jgi:hypothetical protein
MAVTSCYEVIVKSNFLTRWVARPSLPAELISFVILKNNVKALPIYFKAKKNCDLSYSS